MGSCTNCKENEAEVYPSPKDYVSGKHLTLFGFTLIAYREKTETIDDLCSSCLVDRSNAYEHERLDSALSDAYDKGYDDGLRGSHE